MRKYLILAAVLLLSSVTTTVAQDVRYNFAQGEDFLKYKTYKWVDLKGADQANELTQKQIKQAIDTNLATKGLQKVLILDAADLYLDIQTAVGTEKQFTSYNTGWGYGPGWRGLVWIWWRHGLNDNHRVDVHHICWGTWTSYV